MAQKSSRRRLKMPTSQLRDYRLCDQRCRPLLWSIWGFAELQDALNTVWEVQAKPERGLINVIRSRFCRSRWCWALAFTDRVTRGQRCINADQFSATIPGIDSLWHLANILSFAITTLVFGLIIKFCQMSKLPGVMS